MSTRRILMALIALLSLIVIIGGAGVAGLAYYRLVTQRGGADLLVLDADRRLRLLAENGKERLLAEDLSANPLLYPAAAPDGERIAYFSEDADGVALNSLDLRSGEHTKLYQSRSDPPFYAVWSPDSSTISFLSARSAGGLGVYTVAADGTAPSAQIGATLGSSYFAWQPEGGRLLLHMGGSGFENGKVAVYEPGSSEPSHELADPGFFHAPAWSVDGTAFFYVAQPTVGGATASGQVESVLTRVAADGSSPQVLASEAMPAIFFSRAPASDDIAYITVGPNSLGGLKVVDAAGGAARTISRPGEAIPAFFWSPDGSQLAYLTIAAAGEGLPQLTWHVVAREGGEVRDLASFTPSQAFAGMIGFFDAYALDLWSPDGSRIVYGTDQGVYVVDVASGEAVRRADGVLGMWAR